MGVQSRRTVLRLKPGFPVAAGVAILLLIFGALVLAQVAERTDGGPVYSVAALRAHLARDPDAWVDRPLRVRAIASICSAWLTLTRVSTCAQWQPALIDPGVRGGEGPLPLVRGPAPPLVSLLRRLPILGLAATAPQQPRWNWDMLGDGDALTVYRIQLHALPCGPRGRSPCYEALLLDGVSGLLHEDKQPS